MKKILIILLSIFLTGCTFNNLTPKNTAIEFFNNYKKNSDVVKQELYDYLKGENLSEVEFNKYMEVYLKQYSNLKYEIKDVNIYDNSASIKTSINVFNYLDTSNSCSNYFINNQTEFMDDDGDIKLDKYLNYKLNSLINTTDRITYDLTLNLTKINGYWEINALNEDDYLKLHGMYKNVL